MSIFVTPEPRNPFAQAENQLIQGFEQRRGKQEQKQQSDILGQVLQQAQVGEGDFLENLLSGLGQSGLPIETQLGIFKNLEPLAVGRQKQQQKLQLVQQLMAQGLSEEEANLVASAPGPLQGSVFESISESLQSKKFDQSNQSGIGKVESLLDTSKPISQVLGDDGMTVEDTPQLENREQVTFTSGDPLPKSLQSKVEFARKPAISLQSQLNDIENQKSAIESSGLPEKKKNSRIARLNRDQAQKQKQLNDLTKPSVSQQNRFEKVTQDSQKAARALEQIDRARELLNQGVASDSQLGARFTGAKTEKLGLKSDEQAEFVSLGLDLLTQRFSPLPRIKSEFDAIVKGNISLFNTRQGNELILDRMEQVAELSREAANIQEQLRDLNVPNDKVNSLVDQIVQSKADQIIQKFKSDTREAKRDMRKQNNSTKPTIDQLRAEVERRGLRR